VTARNAPAHKRVIKTLRARGVEVDESAGRQPSASKPGKLARRSCWSDST
jgi:hypothetical protein